MGITIFKIFTWGGILSDIRSEITFYGSARAGPNNKISDRISDNIPLQMKIVHTVIPLMSTLANSEDTDEILQTALRCMLR